MPRVGGEVEAFCNGCRLLLAHTVIAMVGAQPVQVECNTCHRRSALRRGAAPGGRPPRGEPRPPGFDDPLARRDAALARRYAPGETYDRGQVLDHPQFGRGFVSALRDGGKMEVTFRDGAKTLVHGRRQR